MAGKTVLIVDDSKVSRMMVKALINELDSSINILESESGNDTLELVKKHKIDYFSVDLNMPGMNGLELINKLKPIYTEAKYSLLTANVQDAIHKQCDDLGINFTEKPVTEDCIKEMLEYFNG